MSDDRKPMSDYHYYTYGKIPPERGEPGRSEDRAREADRLRAERAGEAEGPQAGRGWDGELRPAASWREAAERASAERSEPTAARPFGAETPRSDAEPHGRASAAAYGREPQPGVEIAPPRELRAVPAGPHAVGAPKPAGGWSYSEARPPRRGAFRSVVASFLAGALVVGGLMFASDRMDLFSGSDVLATGGGGAAGSATVASANAGGGSAVETAAIDVVRPNTIAELVEIASPAVVKIETFASQRQRGRTYQDLFDEFFGVPSPQTPQPESGSKVQTGSGSGFFFDAEGYILTNEHVINGAEEVRVIVEGEKEPYTAKVLGTAYDLDLAVLKIEGDGDFPTLPLGSSDTINVGDWVVAIGNPYEFDHTVTVGVLSAKERAINIPDSEGTRRYQALLQTDASINPGNSGGPLLNLNGQVIGINTAVNAQAQGIGFAIPTSTITDVLEALKTNQEIPRPFIGVGVSDVPEQYVDDLGLDNTNGAFITEVMLGSPAYRAGLQMYDVVVAIDGKAVATAEDLTNMIREKKPGDSIAMKVIRNGGEATVNVTVGDRNEAMQE